MRRLGSLIEQLKRWISRYRLALNYTDARDRRRSGKVIGELRRRSSDAPLLNLVEIAPVGIGGIVGFLVGPITHSGMGRFGRPLREKPEGKYRSPRRRSTQRKAAGRHG